MSLRLVRHLFIASILAALMTPLLARAQGGGVTGGGKSDPGKAVSAAETQKQKSLAEDAARARRAAIAAEALRAQRAKNAPVKDPACKDGNCGPKSVTDDAACRGVNFTRIRPLVSMMTAKLRAALEPLDSNAAPPPPAPRVWDTLMRENAAALRAANIVPGRPEHACFKSVVYKTNGVLLEPPNVVGDGCGAGPGAAEMVCGALLGPVCQLGKMLQSFSGFVAEASRTSLSQALNNVFERLKTKLEQYGKGAERKIVDFFQGFGRWLKQPTVNTSDVGKFSMSLFTTLMSVLGGFHQLMGMPQPLCVLVTGSVSAGLTGALLPPLTLMVSLHIGMRNLMNQLIPELLVSTGNAYNAATASRCTTGKPEEIARCQAAEQQSNELMTRIYAMVKTAAGVGGGLLVGLQGDKTKREALQAKLSKVAAFAGKLKSGIERGIDLVAEKLRGGKFSEVEKAYLAAVTGPAGGAPAPKAPALTAAESQKLIPAVVEFARDQVWELLNPVLQKVLGKAMSLLGKVLDIPRNALVAVVGSVPFAGGVLSSVLNFGLGILVDLLQGFLQDQIMGFAKTMIDDNFADLSTKMTARASAQTSAAQGVVEFAKLIAKMAGDVAQVAGAAAGGLGGAAVTLARTALDQLLLQYVSDPTLRGAISDALDGLGAAATSRGFSLTGAIVTVVTKLRDGRKLAKYLARITNAPEMEQWVTDALSRVVRILSAEGGVARIMRNPAGFVGGIAMELVRGPLVSLLTAQIKNDASLSKKLGDGLRASLARLVPWVSGEAAPTLRGVLDAINDFGQPMTQYLVEKVPVADPAVRALVGRGASGLLWAATHPAELHDQYLTRPWAIVGALADLSREVVVSKVRDAVTDVQLAPEKDLLAGSVSALLTTLADETKRQKVLGIGGRPEAATILQQLFDVVRPWLRGRVRLATKNTKLEGLAGAALDGIAGPAAITDFPAWLRTSGQRAIATLVGATAELLDTELRAANASAPATALVRGLLGAARSALEAEGGVAALLSGGLGAGLALLQNAVKPAIDALPANDAGAVLGKEILASLATSEKLGTVTTPAQAFAAALRALRAPISAFLESQVKDRALSALAGAFLAASFEFSASSLEAPAAAGTAAKTGLASLITALAGFLKEKLVAAFPTHLVALRDAVANAWDALLEQGLDLLTKNDAIARLRDGGALRLLSRVLVGFFPVVRGPVLAAITNAPARGLVGRLIESLEGLVSRLDETTRTFAGGARAALGVVLPMLSRILRPFTDEVLVAPITHRGAQSFVRASLDGAYGLLESPDRLVAYKTMRPQDIGRELLTTLVPALLGFIEDASLRQTLESAARMALGALGGGGGGG